MAYVDVVTKLEKQLKKRLNDISEAWAIEDQNELRDIAEKLAQENFAFRSVIADMGDKIPERTKQAMGSVIKKARDAEDLT